MVVLDPDIVRVSFDPAEGDPPLVVDADTICPLALSLQLFEPIASRHAQIVRPPTSVDLA